jgi:UDP:flavonoid glycosyltransferase YjiC (YdhE family)
MRVLFTTLREKSHLLAMTPFIEGCLRSGHEVAVSAPPDFASSVAPTGARFMPFGHPGDEGLRPIWARMREVPWQEATQIAAGELFAGACAGAALPGLIETLERWRPAVVLRESMEFAGLVAAEKVGIPHVRVAISARGAEAELRAFSAPWVNGHRTTVGLSPDPVGDRIRDEPAVTLFPPSFEPNDTMTAPLARFRAERPSAPPLPDWWPGLEGPFLYVTLGTVTGGLDILRDVYRRTVDALADLPVRALLTAGASLPMEAIGDVPANVHVERFVPQDAVLPHARATLCHGGSGTVLGALAAGTPMVVTPMFADQPYNAARVVALGAGIATSVLDASPQEIRSALDRVLEGPSFLLAAQKMKQEIAALPSVDETAGVVARIAGYQAG